MNRGNGNGNENEHGTSDRTRTTRETENDELYSLLREIVLSDYDYSRNFRSFLDTSYQYFTNSANNSRQLYALVNRVLTQNEANNVNSTENSQTRNRTSSFNNFPYYRDIPETPLPSVRPLYASRLNTTAPPRAGRFNAQRRNQFRHRNLQTGFNETSNTNPNTNTTTTREPYLNNLLNILAGNVFTGGRQRTIPTERDISNNCTTMSFSDCSSNQTMCPIDRIEFEPTDQVMRINGCGHIFREENLRRVFQNESRCPMCRYNILANTSGNEGSNTNTNANENTNENGNTTEENRQRLTNTIRNAFSIANNNDDTITGSDSFIDSSGNNVSVEYMISSQFL